MHIIEPKIESSAIIQWFFLKRHNFKNLTEDVLLGTILAQVKLSNFMFEFTGYVHTLILLNNIVKIKVHYFHKKCLKITSKNKKMIRMKQNPSYLEVTKNCLDVNKTGGTANKRLTNYLTKDIKIEKFRILWDDILYDGILKI